MTEANALASTAANTTVNSAASEWRKFWHLPLAGALGYATSVLHVYGIGPFFAPLQQEFGWSRAQLSAGLTVAATLSGLCCIPLGMLVDRIGPRRIGLVGVVLMCVAFALLGTLTGSTVNWFVLWVLLGIGVTGIHPTVWTNAVASRFVTSRGLAFAVTLAGASFSAALFPVLAAWLIGVNGWRTAFFAMAGLWACLVVPAVFFGFRGARDAIPRSSVAAPEAASTLTGLSFAEGLRTATFYKLLFASGLFAFTILGNVVHFVPILTERGATPLAAASIAGIVGIFSIFGRLGTGVLLDRFPAQHIGAVAMLIPIVACALLLLSGANPLSQSIAAAIFGLTLGSEVDVVAYLAAQRFGLKNHGALYGALVMALSVGTAFGPLAAGMVFDHYGSYAPFLMLSMVLVTCSAAALVSLGPPALKSVMLAGNGVTQDLV